MGDGEGVVGGLMSRCLGEVNREGDSMGERSVGEDIVGELK